MDYQTLLNDAASWIFSDPKNIAYVIGAVVVIGAIKGIGRSLRWCGHTRHIGRRVL